MAHTHVGLRAVVASHLSPHFTTAVTQDAEGGYSMAATLARDAIVAALGGYLPAANAG